MKYTHAHAREVIFVIRETMRPSKDNLVHEVLSGHNVKWNNLFFYGEREREKGRTRFFFSRGLKILDGLVNFLIANPCSFVI